MTVVEYSPDTCYAGVLESVSHARQFIDSRNNVWIHVQGEIDADSLKELGDVFGLHPLVQEDVLNESQRAKVESYGDGLFLVLALPTLGNTHISISQVSLFAMEKVIISFDREKSDPFQGVRGRLEAPSSPLCQEPVDMLLYALIDITIDQGFPILEHLGEELESLEDELLESPGQDTLKRLHRVRRLLLFLRRRLWPQREVVNNLLRDTHPAISNHTRVYLRDCYDHAIEVIELIESYREMSSGMLDVYLSSVSYRLNEVMRMLTVIATVFMPLTFITGIYGMNFGQNHHSPLAMPELDWYYGYPLVWLSIVLVAAGMLLYFRRKRWL